MATQAVVRQNADATATTAAILAQATATEFDRQAQATSQALMATQEVVNLNAGATSTALALGATATSLARVQPAATYTVRMSNVDDIATLYIGEEPIYKAQWGKSGTEPKWSDIGHQPGDSGEVDITPLLNAGDNVLRFELKDVGCCGAYLTVEVRENGKVIFSDTFSQQDSDKEVPYKKTVTITAK
jgi:hypothetical protein